MLVFSILFIYLLIYLLYNNYALYWSKLYRVVIWLFIYSSNFFYLFSFVCTGLLLLFDFLVICSLSLKSKKHFSRFLNSAQWGGRETSITLQVAQLHNWHIERYEVLQSYFPLKIFTRVFTTVMLFFYRRRHGGGVDWLVGLLHCSSHGDKTPLTIGQWTGSSTSQRGSWPAETTREWLRWGWRDDWHVVWMRD